MVKIDLITGFLGSGKTTFIRKYAKYLIDRGMHIGILENDFGAINVDMMLLQDLLGDNCELEMVSGGCDRDCHRRRFKTKLIAMGMCGYDRVIVEPSGIYDVDEFFDALYEEPLDQWYEIGNVIAIVDAKLQENLSKEAEYLLASEAADAGRIILSRADEATPEEMDRTVERLNKALEQVKCKRRLDKEVIRKGIPDLREQDLQELVSCGYVSESYIKMDLGDFKGFDSLFFMNIEITEEELRKAVSAMMKDEACGRIFRVKGFIQKSTGEWLQLNATHDAISLKPIEAGQKVLIVIGENLCEEAIRKFHDLGLEVWMDDFGSGYSNLNILKELDFDVIKLDMAFLRNFNCDSAIIIKNIIHMARELNIRTLAEGVETRDLFDFLQEAGCDMAQGYYFSRPIPLEEIREKHFLLP